MSLAACRLVAGAFECMAADGHSLPLWQVRLGASLGAEACLPLLCACAYVRTCMHACRNSGPPALASCCLLLPASATCAARKLRASERGEAWLRWWRALLICCCSTGPCGAGRLARSSSTSSPPTRLTIPDLKRRGASLPLPPSRLSSLASRLSQTSTNPPPGAGSLTHLFHLVALVSLVPAAALRPRIAGFALRVHGMALVLGLVN